MTHDFCIRLALELPSFGDQFVAERLEIFDDPVVHEGDGADDVRVRVADCRSAMRRPARMGDAGNARERFGIELASKIVEFALGPTADELAIVDRANAGRIITAIFEPLQPIEQPPRDVAVPDDSNDPAHYARVTPLKRPWRSAMPCPLIRGGWHVAHIVAGRKRGVGAAFRLQASGAEWCGRRASGLLL